MGAEKKTLGYDKSIMELVAIIPARAGSERLPGKNTLVLNGKPLLAWTIEAAINSGCFKQIFLTSDDVYALNIGKSYDNISIVKRPKVLSTKMTSSDDVILHCLSFVSEADAIVLLQPTSPLRKPKHIKEAIRTFEKTRKKYGIDALISVSDRVTPSKHKIFVNPNTGLICLKRDSRYCLQRYVNGAIYINDFATVKNSGTIDSDLKASYFMEKDLSVDIDYESDFQECRTLMKHYDY